MDNTPIADPTTNGAEATDIAVAPTENGAAAKDQAATSDIKEEDPSTIAEMMEDAEAAATAAGSDFGKGAAEANKDVSAAPDATEDASEAKETVSEAKEGASGDQEGEPATPMAVDKVEPSTETEMPAKETKKRVRRVGRTPTRKIPKLEEKATPVLEGGDNNNDNAQVEAAAVDAATAAIGAVPETPDAIEPSSTIVVPQQPPTQGVLSKHDEKWHAMFQKLMEFKERNKHTLVPQCYTEDPRLGRWVHYQRVEYWIFQQKGTAKITEERIARLNHIGFEWDPQKAQWEKMFAKLKEFKKEFSHCRVPKGYDKDWELANWVRNQRLEQANLSKEGKKSRMTPERFKLLDDLGFKWSSPTPARARRNRQVAKKAEAVNGEEQKGATSNEAPTVPKQEDVPTAESAPAVVPGDDKATEPTDPAQAEAMTAAANVVGNLSNEENNGFVQDAIEGKAADEENTKPEAQAEAPPENVAVV